MNSVEKRPFSSLTHNSDTWSKCDTQQTINSYIASDIHLQNLGLSMTSGKPRFKLNEMCSSFTRSSHCLQNFQDENVPATSDSFVVLTHPSLEMVQAQSLANYIQIQEKCTSIDHNSVISSMSPLEIEQKLSDLLHENHKLKETLIENNLAMKKQFNSLAAWQETISYVHQNHKEKFAETRELIDHLKQENIKLKLQVSINDVQDVSLQKMLAENDGNFTQLVNASNATTAKGSVEEYQTLHKINEDVIVPNLKFKKNVEDMKEILIKEMEANLEHHIDTTSENAIISIQLPDYVESLVKRIPRAEFHQELMDTVKPYHENMETLVNCFSVQSSRYVYVQECLNKCTEILQNYETFSNEIQKDVNLTVLTSKNSLSECRKKLINEQLKNIDDHQKWIRIQNHLKTLFYDYISILCELEISQEKNRKLLLIQNENSHENFLCDKFFNQDKTTLATEMKNISLEKLSLYEEKKSLDKLRESLISNQENLNTEVEKIKLQRLSLLEEKTALDRQSKLYEEEEIAFTSKKRNVMKKSEELVERIVSLEEQLKTQNESTYSDKENLMVLRAQVDIYRTDFEQEKAVKKNLIREKNKLIEQIQHLTLQNQDLRRNLDQFRRVQYYEGEQASLLSNSSSHKTNGNQESTNSSSSTVIQIYSCPLCGQKFSSIDPLVQHTESCIILSEQS